MGINDERCIITLVPWSGKAEVIKEQYGAQLLRAF